MHVYIKIFIENDFFTQIVAVMPPPSAMNIPPVQNEASSDKLQSLHFYPIVASEYSAQIYHLGLSNRKIIFRLLWALQH